MCAGEVLTGSLSWDWLIKVERPSLNPFDLGNNTGLPAAPPSGQTYDLKFSKVVSPFFNHPTILFSGV